MFLHVIVLYIAIGCFFIYQCPWLFLFFCIAFTIEFFKRLRADRRCRGNSCINLKNEEENQEPWSDKLSGLFEYHDEEVTMAAKIDNESVVS